MTWDVATFQFVQAVRKPQAEKLSHGNSHHCKAPVSIAEHSLWSKSRKTGIDLLYGQMWSRRKLNSFALGCKHFWSNSAILFLFWKPTTKPETAHWLIALLPSYMQPVCSFTLNSVFHFLTAGHSSTPSCTLCQLARSLCWQSSRRSPIKRDFLHLRSYPWRNHCEIRAPRTTLRFVFPWHLWLQMLPLFPPA